MSKLYYPTPEELRGDRPLNEQLWFPRLQDVLVTLANTQEGKDLLCIDDLGLPIVRLAKNEVRYDASKELGPRTYISDFRVGAKWGNIIRYRWQEVKKAIDRMSLEYLLALPKHVVSEQGLFVPVPAGAASLTAYPDPDPESTTFDGNVARQVYAATWTSLVTGAGTENNSSTGGLTVCQQLASNNSSGQPNASNWWQCVRSGILFNTSALTVSATVSAATISIRGNEKRDDLSIAPNSDIYTFAPASNTGLVNGDYSNFGGVSQTGSPITYANWSASAYVSFTLNGTGRGNVSKTSISKFGCRNANYDVANSNPGNWVGYGRSTHGGRSADYSGTTSDPKLVVTYSFPTASIGGNLGNGATEQEVRDA